MKSAIFAIAAAALAVFASQAASAASVPMGKHHAKMACETCHQPASALKGNAFVVPSDKVCQGCHGSYESLAKKTAGKDEPNPHASAHYGTSLSCTACHKQHSEPVSYCNNCHEFRHVMP